MIDSGVSLKRLGRLMLLVAITAVAFGMAGLPKSHAAATETELWEALRSGGHVALMRHAIAPGTGDPPDFTLGACETQRNLSEEGRAQARRIGARFRANGISRASIFSSQWCRCEDTARLLQLGPVTALPALNSFYQRSENRNPQMRALRGWLTRQDFRDVHMLVTHQVNITALTGVYPRSGEIVVVRFSKSGDIAVVGNIATD